MSKNIILVGMGGVGKTTVAKLLAQKTSAKLVDTDSEIESQNDLKIKDLIEQKGWGYFREQETILLKKLSELKDATIISTGGGIILSEENRKLLKRIGRVILLWASPQTLTERVGEGYKNRPLLGEKSQVLDSFKKLSQERLEAYLLACDLLIDTENKSTEEIVDQITEYAEKEKVDQTVKNFCVVGHPVAHSLSPIIHLSAFRSMGLAYSYMTVDVEKIEDGIRIIKEEPYDGVSITVPHKISAVDLLDTIDEDVKAIGAVNTVLNRGDKLYGYNSDWYGAIESLNEYFGEELKQKNAILLGAGGAARAICYGLKKASISFVILNRNVEKAKVLAQEFGAEDSGSLEDFAKYVDCDIIINSTTVGLDTTESPIDSNALTPEHTVFDIVYKPHVTRLIQDAKTRGAKVIYGYKMLIYQAKRQFELFTERDFPTDLVEKILINHLT